MRVSSTLAAVAILLLAGCLGAVDETPLDPQQAKGLTSVFERGNLPFVRDDEFSRTLLNGTFGILPVESIYVGVPLPVTELGGAPFDPQIHMGLWLPDVPAGTKVPVIADVGPYYGDMDVDALTPAERLGRFLIENFVPHGYAVAQVSVFGTGESGHCMDLMGHAEQAGVDAAVTWLATQEWSNGNVGLIGRSYDGSTPWEAATFGNPALKTIVPISGLTGAHELMWRNGSAEYRGPIMHNGVYGYFGIDTVQLNPYALLERESPLVGVNPGKATTEPENACADYLTGPVHGLGALLTDAHTLPAVRDYWAERSFLDRALENYDGSVYFIHGMQDWNVDPHVAFPAYQRIQDAGIETKGLFGQWGHMYPDRASEHENLRDGRGAEAYPASVRLDWAQDLLEWFDHYLMETGPKPALHVEIQDNAGAWRIEPTWPPADAAWTETTLADAKKGHQGPDVVRPTMTLLPTLLPLVYDLPALSDTEDVRIAGLPQLHLTVTPTGPGGQVFAELQDAETGMHLGHAIMDLRFHAGGSEMGTVVPGQALVARMEFEPLDVVLPAGHGLRLVLAATGEDYLPSLVQSPIVVSVGEESVLRLPLIERGADVFFTPPGPEGDAKGDTPEF